METRPRLATRSRRTGQVTPDNLVLRVAIRDSAPEIWRRLLVPSSYTLDQSHRVLQLVFGWLDYHMYEFEIGTRRFESHENDEAEGEDARRIALRDLAPVPGDRWLYRYDFGDDWAHDIVVEERRPNTDPLDRPLPYLLDGERAGPPEDCGGTGGLAELLRVLKAPRTKAGREMRAWVGASYDPSRFDAWHVDRMLTLAAAYGAI